MQNVCRFIYTKTTRLYSPLLPIKCYDLQNSSVCFQNYFLMREGEAMRTLNRIIALAFLGGSFFAPMSQIHAENGSDQDSTWTDPVTKGEWRFAAGAVNWKGAKAACGNGGLPDHPTIAHAAGRLSKSPLGDLIRAAESKVVWSSDEFDWYSAMLVYIPEGDAYAEGKQFLFPVLCYKKAAQ